MKWNITYVFFYIRQKPRRLQSVNQALYLSVEILQPRLPARVSGVESWYLTPSKAYINECIDPQTDAKMIVQINVLSTSRMDRMYSPTRYG